MMNSISCSNRATKSPIVYKSVPRSDRVRIHMQPAKLADYQKSVDFFLIKPGFHKANFDHDNDLLSQNKAISGKDDCSTT